MTGGEGGGSAAAGDGGVDEVVEGDGVEEKEEEGAGKSGVLYKKREVFPGWRPRTFILDRRMRLLRCVWFQSMFAASASSCPNRTRCHASHKKHTCSCNN